MNLLASIAAAALACSSGHKPTPAPTDSIVAIVHASVIPMDQEHVLPDHTVIVRGDRIVAVGPAASTPVPEGATVIDGAGRFLLPGLAEMHGHIPPPDAPADHIERSSSSTSPTASRPCAACSGSQASSS
ncbi:MAG: hypothetical protein ABR527_04130 [Gemmatimonadota bacterium]